MIPAGLAATHVAFSAWTASTSNGLDQLGEDDLGDTYKALSAALLRDVEDVHAEIKHLMIRRIMATKKGPAA